MGPGALLRSCGRPACTASGSRPDAQDNASYAFNGPWGNQKTFFQDVVQTLDGEVDFSRFDAVFVNAAPVLFRPGVPSRPSPDADVLAAPGTGVVADGKELRHFGQPSLPATAFRSLLHLSGLPPIPQAAGVWDPMSPGSRGGPIDRLGAPCLAPAQAGLARRDPDPLPWLDADRVDARANLVERRREDGRGGDERDERHRAGEPAAGGLDAIHCRRGVLAYEVRTNVEAGIAVLPADSSNRPECGHASLAAAPYDVKAGDTIRVGGAVSFHVLSVGEDGSYRLRVSR